MKKVFLCAMLVCAVLFASCNGVANGGDGLDANDPTVDRTPPAQFVETDANYIKFNNANVNLGYNEKVILKTLTNVKPEDESRIKFVVDYTGKGIEYGKPGFAFAPITSNNYDDAYYIDTDNDPNNLNKTVTIALYIDGAKTDKKCTVKVISGSGVGTPSGSGGGNGGGATGGSGNPSGGSGSGSGSGNSGYVLPPNTSPTDTPLVGIFSLDDRDGDSGNWHVFIFGADGTFRYSACTGHDGAYQKAHGGYVYGKEKQVAGTYRVTGYAASDSRQITFNVTQRTLERAVTPQMVAWEDWNGDKGFYLTYTRDKIAQKRIFKRDSVLENKYSDWR